MRRPIRLEFAVAFYHVNAHLQALGLDIAGAQLALRLSALSTAIDHLRACRQVLQLVVGELVMRTSSRLKPRATEHVDRIAGAKVRVRACSGVWSSCGAAHKRGT